MTLKVYDVNVTESIPAIEVMFDISEWNTSYRYNNISVCFEDGKFSIASQAQWSYFSNWQQTELKKWTAAIFRLMFPNKTFK